MYSIQRPKEFFLNFLRQKKTKTKISNDEIIDASTLQSLFKQCRRTSSHILSSRKSNPTNSFVLLKRGKLRSFLKLSKDSPYLIKEEIKTNTPEPSHNKPHPKYPKTSTQKTNTFWLIGASDPCFQTLRHLFSIVIILTLGIISFI